jgi:hypothetical protein
LSRHNSECKYTHFCSNERTIVESFYKNISFFSFDDWRMVRVEGIYVESGGVRIRKKPGEDWVGKKGESARNSVKSGFHGLLK